LKAVLLYEHGKIENLTYTEDYPIPVLKENEILVKVKGVALNHLDLFVRKGLPGLKLEMPHILGSDISGTISKIGSKVQRGGYAEYIAVPESNIIPVPDTSPISLLDAAAVPLTFMTAYRMLMSRAKLKIGEDVLITGISGGVASAALQIAKTMGARTFVTSSTDEKLNKAKDLGADFLINYQTNPDYHKEVYQLTHKRGVDVVIDSAGEATWEKSMRSLRKGGRMVTCGATTGPMATTNIRLLFWKQLDLLGSTMGTRSDAQKAHEYLEDGKQFGKIILEPEN
jgi:NADPH:quinone reductase-like Zn-dependent oxidoreductase